MKKRWLSVLLAAVLTANSLPFGVLAEEGVPAPVEVQTGEESLNEANPEPESAAESESISDAEETTESEEPLNPPVIVDNGGVVDETYIPDPDILPDSDELLEGYFQMQTAEALYGGISTYGDYGISDLSPKDQKFYNALLDRIKKVAAGELTSTKFTFTMDELGIPKTFTPADLGVDEIYSQANGKNQLAIDEAQRRWLPNNIKAITDRLLYNTPYELYWYDKTKGYSYPTSLGYTINYDASIKKYVITQEVTNEDGSITEGVTYAFRVAKDYSAAKDVGTCDVDTSKVTAPQNAAANAASIIAANEGKSDYQKLYAYCNEICQLIDYNWDAYNNKPPYGDPWQLIYVFDGDPATKVVCEGYSKAFQYLCDSSSFSGDTTCYTVTGGLDGGTGAGGHMWNIVTIGGKNYLVDVTNSDSNGMDKLFMRGSTGSVGEGYYSNDLPRVKFTYDDDTKALYPNNILTLSPDPYVEALDLSAADITATELTYNGQDQTPVLTVVLNGQTLVKDTDYTFSPETVKNAGPYTLTVTGVGNYSGTKEVPVTVKPATLTPEISGTTNKTYDGTVNAPSGLSIQLTGIVPGDVVTAAAAKYEYDSKDAGERTLTAAGITLSGTDSGNYVLTSDSAQTTGRIEATDILYTINDQPIQIGKGVDSILHPEKADGVGSEKVSGQLVWYEDSAMTNQVPVGFTFTGSDNTTVTLYWKFTPDADQNNYKSDAKTGSCTFTLKTKLDDVIITVSGSQALTYGYTDSPKLSAELSVYNQVMSEGVSYQWYQAGEKIEGAVEKTLTVPAGLGAGTYKYTCQATYNNMVYSGDPVEVTVTKAKLTPAISGNTSKVYDGTTSAPADVEISLSGLVNGDTVTAEADWSYDAKDAGDNRQLKAENIRLSGDKKDNYELTVTSLSTKAQISQKDIAVADVSVKKLTYNGQEQTPQVTVKDGSIVLTYSDFAVQPQTLKDAKTYELAITGKGNYKGQKKVPVTVDKAELKASIEGNTTKVYDATMDASGVSIKLNGVVGSDILTATAKFAYDSANAGKRKLTASDIAIEGTAKDNYTLKSNSISVGAEIEQKDISGAAVTLGPALTYTGSVQTQTVEKVVIDSLQAEYNVSGNENKDSGTYTLTVTGTGNFTGTITKEYTIAPVNMNDVTVTAAPLTYNGQEQTPVFTVTYNGQTLVKDKDYSVSAPSELKNAGEYSFKISGMGNYTGDKPVSVEIKKAAVTAKISGEPKNKTYDGTTDASGQLSIALDGVITGTDVSAKATTIAYDKADAGERKLVAEGITLSGADKDNYILESTSVTENAVIEQRDISSLAQAELSADVLTYNGKAQEKTVNDVTLDGKSILNSVDIAGNKQTNAGTYEIKISGKGNYEGAITEKFTIEKADYTYAISDQPVRIGNAVDTMSYNADATGVNNEKVSGKLAWFEDEAATKPLPQDYVFAGKEGEKLTLYWTFTPDSTNTNYIEAAKSGKVVLTLQNKIVPKLTVSDYSKDYDKKVISASQILSGAKAVDEKGNEIKGTWTVKGLSNYIQAGTYNDVSVVFDPDDQVNIVSSQTVITIEIKPITIYVTAAPGDVSLASVDKIPEGSLVMSEGIVEGDSLTPAKAPVFKTALTEDKDGMLVYTVKLEDADVVQAEVVKLANGNYNIVWQVKDSTITVKKVESQVTVDDDTSAELIVVLDHFTDSKLEEIKEQYPTVEAVDQAMKDFAQEAAKTEAVFTVSGDKEASVKEWNGKVDSVLLNIDLYKKEDGKTTIVSDTSEVAADGFWFGIPYPAGTNSSDYAFMVLHMYDKAEGGYEAGAVNQLTVKLEKDRILAFTKSCSPIMVLWAQKDEVKVVEPAKPDTSVKPEVPVTPDTPVKPDVPVVPQTPVQPQTPTEPKVPITPVTPQTPTDSQVTVTPQTPVVPQTSTTPQTNTDTAKTGSDFNPLAAVAVMFVSGLTVMAIYARRRRKSA